MKEAELKVLRTIIGGKLKNGVWRRRMNSEFYEVYKDAYIIRRVKYGRRADFSRLIT